MLPFGAFGANMDKVDKMLPFERSMAFIALNDRSQVSLDRKLYK